MTNNNQHLWFQEQIAAYLADGLPANERQRFEEHAAACESCAAALAEARETDRRLSELFEDLRPDEQFEDRLIARLGRSTRYAFISPMLRTAAALAAVVVLAAVGHIGSIVLTGHRLPSFSADFPAAAPGIDMLGGPRLIYHIDRRRASSSLRQVEPNVLHANGHVEWQKRPVTPDEMARAYNTNVLQGQRNAAEEKNNPYDDILAYTKDGAELEEMSGDRTPAHVPDGGTLLLGGKAALAGDEVGERRSSLHYSYANADVGFRNSRSIASGDAFRPGDAIAQATWGSSPRGGGFGGGGSRDFEWADTRDGQRGQWDAQIRPPALETEPAGSRPAVTQAPPAADTTAPRTTEPAPPAPDPGRRIIRNGEMEFEVDSFDAAAGQVARIAAEEEGFISTMDSERLPNGKVKGTIILRVPPERLDTLVLKLRALGDLKSQRITAQDVTRQYTDTAGELRANRAMEERLLEIIRTQAGEIKDLLEAEKQLGIVRERIEKLEGQIRYFDNLIALSTLTITLSETDIRTPSTAAETEQVNLGLETEDVRQSRDLALVAIEEAGGRIVESDLKQHEAGQFAARIVAEVPPDEAGAVIDRLRQLGRVARLEIERRQTTEGPQPAATTAPARIERRQTRLAISMYNLANVAPRQTTNLNLAAEDVEAAYQAVLELIGQAEGRIVTSALTGTRAEQTTATLHFEMPADRADAVQAAVRTFGEVMRLAVTENPDTQNVTTSKRGFNVQIVSIDTVQPRQTVQMRLATTNVAQAYHQLHAFAAERGGRILGAQLNEQDRRNVTASLDLEIPRDQQPALDAAMAAAGDVFSRVSQRSADTANTVDTKLRIQLTVLNVDQIAPRETHTLAIEVQQVEQSLASLQERFTAAGARVIESNVSRDRSGQVVGKVVIDVPLSQAPPLLERIRGEARVIRLAQSSHNPQVPDGRLARARIDLTLASGEAIVGADRGLWQSLRGGLTTSITGLLWSLQLIVIGLFLVGPWALLLWIAWRVLRPRRTSVA